MTLPAPPPLALNEKVTNASRHRGARFAAKAILLLALTEWRVRVIACAKALLAALWFAPARIIRGGSTRATRASAREARILLVKIAFRRPICADHGADASLLEHWRSRVSTV